MKIDEVCAGGEKEYRELLYVLWGVLWMMMTKER